MGQLNNCFLAGYAGRDAESRDTKAGPVVSFPLAYTKKGKNGGEDQTTWVRVVAFKGYTGDRAAQVRKGDNVFATGELSVRPYKGKDGAERVDVSITAYSLEILVKPPPRQEATKRDEPDLTNPDELPF
jgi:single-strand DNA-binding protein